MPSWLVGKTRPSTPPSVVGLAHALSSYPPLSPAFPGHGPGLALPHAQTNFEQLMEALPGRLAIVTPVMAAAGCDPGSALAGGDPRPMLGALCAWTRAEWIASPQPWRGREGGWRASDRAGPDIALSFFVDVGLALGEVVRAQRPEYAWALNAEAADEAMAYYRQPVLRVTAPEPGLQPPQMDFDMAGLVVHEASGGGLGWMNPFESVVADTVLGRHEATWRARDGVIGESIAWDAWLAGSSHATA